MRYKADSSNSYREEEKDVYELREGNMGVKIKLRELRERWCFKN